MDRGVLSFWCFLFSLFEVDDDDDDDEVEEDEGEETDGEVADEEGELSLGSTNMVFEDEAVEMGELDE